MQYIPIIVLCHAQGSRPGVIDSVNARVNRTTAQATGSPFCRECNGSAGAVPAIKLATHRKDAALT